MKYRVYAEYRCKENEKLLLTGSSEEIACELRAMKAYCSSLSIGTGFNGVISLLCDSCALVSVTSITECALPDEAVAIHIQYLKESEFFIDFELVKMTVEPQL